MTNEKALNILEDAICWSHFLQEYFDAELQEAIMCAVSALKKQTEESRAKDCDCVPTAKEVKEAGGGGAIRC